MLDIKTVTILIVLTALIAAPAQFLAARRYKGHIGRSITLWASGIAIGSAGHLLLLLRSVIPNVVSIVGSNTLILAGFAGYGLAVRQLKQVELRPRYYLAVLGAAFLLFGYFVIVDNNTVARIHVANVSMAAIVLPLCRDLFVGISREKRYSYWSSGCLYAWGLLVVAVREAATLKGYYSPHADMMYGSAMQSALFASSFVVTVVTGILFMLMAGDEFASRIARLAARDPLTDIYNRRAFEELAGQSLLAGKKAGSTCALLTLDLDHFKSVNDQHGHAAGDLALRKVTETLARHLRVNDIFGRYGGEEFCILLPGTGRADAQAAAERLRQAVENMKIRIGDDELTMTVSIGLAISEKSERELAALFIESDRALYEAKTLGRNRVTGV